MKLFNRVALFSLIFASGMCAMDRDLTAQIVDLTFVNDTGHTISILAHYKDGRNVAPTMIDKDGKYALKNQNLDQVDYYTATYSHGARGKVFGGSLKIETAPLGLQIAQQGEHSAQIIIKPYTNMVGYVTGFGGYDVRIRPGGAGAATEFKMDESFIAIESSNENKSLLKELGLASDAEPYEIFGLSKPPKVDPKKAFGNQSAEVVKYLKNLEEKKSSLIKKYQDDLTRDKKMYDQYKIKDFSKKMRNLIEAAYQALLRTMGAQ